MPNNEPEYTEVDGIRYYVIPFMTNLMDWRFNHLDCDFIVKGRMKDRQAEIVCYSTGKEYNPPLARIRKTKYPEYSLARGITTEEVYTIV